jgi:hypothetical protein
MSSLFYLYVIMNNCSNKIIITNEQKQQYNNQVYQVKPVNIDSITRFSNKNPRYSRKFDNPRRN